MFISKAKYLETLKQLNELNVSLMKLNNLAFLKDVKQDGRLLTFTFVQNGHEEVVECCALLSTNVKGLKKQ